MAANVATATDIDVRLSDARADLDRLIRTVGHGAERLRETYPDVWQNAEAALELIYAEYVGRLQLGQAQDHEEWYQRFPQWRDRLERLFELNQLLAPYEAEFQRGHPPGYEILEEVGRGSSAIVYRARQVGLNRIVALKVLKAQAWADDGELRREASLAAKLHYPNIVRIHEIGEWDGQSFLSMEFVEHSLDQAIRRQQFSPTDAAQIAEILSRAVHYAHQQGVVHRDLKPANVLVGNGEHQRTSLLTTDNWPLTTLKVADFGLAIPFDSAEQVRRSLNLAGTPCYMAPEQAEARTADIGPRTDVYALGAILYEMLTGRLPFQADTVIATLDLVREGQPVSLRRWKRDIPSDLDVICLKCLSKSPHARYASAEAFGDDLKRWLEGRPIVARPVSVLERAWKWVKRHTVVSGLTAALVIAVALAGMVQAKRQQDVLWANEKQEQSRQQFLMEQGAKLLASAREALVKGQLPETKQFLNEVAPLLRGDEWTALHRLAHAEIACISGPYIGGFLFAVSPDGATAAIRGPGAPKQIDVVDLASRKFIGAFPTSTAAAQYLAFTSDGQELVSLRPSDDEAMEVLIWNLAARQEVRRWHFTMRGIAAISENGERIAAAVGRNINIMDSRTGDLVSQFQDPTPLGKNSSFYWGQGDKLLVLMRPDELWFIEVQGGKTVGQVKLESQSTGLSSLRPDGQIVAIPYTTPRRRVAGINIENGTSAFEITSLGPMRQVRFGPDGRILAFASHREIVLHDGRDGRHLATFYGHQSAIFLFRFSADGSKLFSLAADRTLRIWDITPWLPKNP